MPRKQECVSRKSGVSSSSVLNHLQFFLFPVCFYQNSEICPCMSPGILLSSECSKLSAIVQGVEEKIIPRFFFSHLENPTEKYGRVRETRRIKIGG